MTEKPINQTDDESTMTEVEIPIEECYPDVVGREKTIPAEDEMTETDETMVEMTKSIKQSEVLRDLAEERLDEDDLPEASRLLWIDAAEVYSVCGGCLYENRDCQWTGFTENPNQDELREAMRDRLDSGVPCTFCRSNRIDDLKEQFADEVEVEIEVIRDE